MTDQTPINICRQADRTSITLSDASPTKFLATDREGRIVQVSDRWLAAFRHERVDLLGKPLEAFLTEDSAADVRKAQESGVPISDLNCEFRTGDGRTRASSLSMSNAVSEGDDAGSVFFLTSCVHGERTSEEMTSYRLRSCLEGTNAGTWEWNVQTGETRFNERWAEIVGYRLEELQPISIETWLSLAHPDDLKHSGEALERHWKGETVFYDIEARMRHKDGHWVWVHDRGRVFTWTADGKPEWMFGTHFSLDEQRSRARETERMKRLLDRTGHAAGVGGWELDLETDELLWTEETRRIHAVDDDYIPSISDGIAFYAPEARETITRAVEQCLENGTPWDLELPFDRATGERIWVRARGEVEFQNGEVKRLFGAFQDITDRVTRDAELAAAQAALATAHERLWSAIECIPEAFVLYDANDRLVLCNKKYRDLYGFSADAIRPGMTFESILREGLRKGQYPEAKGQEEQWLSERMERHRNPGKAIEQQLPGDRHLQVHEVRLPNGDSVGFRVDVTQIKRQKRALAEKAKELARSAVTDPMTGLLNRRGLDAYIEARKGTPGLFGVLHIDLDRFKPINDVFGHSAGDHILRKIADILAENARESDCVARVGGDEFVVILNAPCTEKHARRVADRMIEHCNTPIEWQDKNLRFGASVGIALGEAPDLGDLMNGADIALYEAKRNGRNLHRIFNAELREKVRDKKLLSDEFLSALERDEIVAHYQPQLCARTGALVAIEALARWNHPTRGVLAPGAFLGIAEELNMLSEVDTRVFRHGLETSKALVTAGIDLNRMAFNASLKKLTEQPELSWLPKLDDLPFDLSLEILETVDVDREFDEVGRVFDALRERGVGIEIDDFGSGRASLTSLLRLKPDRIKIDGQITRAAMQESTGARGMIQAMGEMCRVLGIPMTAEGIESAEQAVMMEQLGCDLLQGFHLSRPLSQDMLLTWARARAPVQTPPPGKLVPECGRRYEAH